jgi:hypothetical protein
MTTTEELGLPEGLEIGTAWSHVRGAFTRRAHGRALLIETGHPMRANRRGGRQQDTTYRFDPAAAAIVATALAVMSLQGWALGRRGSQWSTG